MAQRHLFSSYFTPGTCHPEVPPGQSWPPSMNDLSSVCVGLWSTAQGALPMISDVISSCKIEPHPIVSSTLWCISYAWISSWPGMPSPCSYGCCQCSGMRSGSDSRFPPEAKLFTMIAQRCVGIAPLLSPCSVRAWGELQGPSILV